MKKILCGFALVLLSSSAWAIPITFTDFTYTTSALAIAGGNIDDNTDVSPPLALPLLTASSANGDNGETASAAAIADDGLLSAQADAFGGALTPSPDGPFGASALGNSEFFGSFIAPGGLLEFAFTLDISGSASGTGSNDGLIRVLVLSGTDTVLEQTFTGPGFYAPFVDLPAGVAASVSFLLLAGATAPGINDVATQFSSASFAVRTVPEPGTLALIMSCVLALGLTTKSDRPKTA